MRKILVILSTILLGFTSCINSGLEDLPVYNEAEITAFNLEYRFVTKNANGVEMMAVVTLGGNAVIDKVAGTITVTPTIPAPTTTFTQAERRKVSLETIVAYGKLSPAAKIEPMDGAPILGTPGNFTAERKYKVTAADGKTTKIWVVKINPLPIINQYEGNYHATGYFNHPTSPRALDLDKYMSSVDASTITGAHSDLGDSGYTITVKINSDNTVVVKQFASGNEIGEMTPGAVNKYDPTTKTFTLNYRYSGSNGWRTVNETLVLK